MGRLGGRSTPEGARKWESLFVVYRTEPWVVARMGKLSAPGLRSPAGSNLQVVENAVQDGG